MPYQGRSIHYARQNRIQALSEAGSSPAYCLIAIYKCSRLSLQVTQEGLGRNGSGDKGDWRVHETRETGVCTLL
jgi:hypothetical protein